MGYHFVPQQYLRCFAAGGKSDFIWLHDKETGDTRLASISKVAQSKEFYAPKTEGILAREVETPANAVIRKLIANSAISVPERFQLTYYIGTMLKRVPYRRRKAWDMYPDVLDDTIATVRKQIEELAREMPGVDPEVVAHRLAELEEVRGRYEQEPPHEIDHQIREPWPSVGMLDAIFRMTWRITISKGPEYFMTTDNPAFFFTCYGLASEESELCLPLSSTHALHGCWQTADSKMLFMNCSQGVVREINRHLASLAERLAFYHEQASWIHELFRTKIECLSVIKWQGPPNTALLGLLALLCQLCE